MPPSEQEINELVSELTNLKEVLPGFIDLTEEQIRENIILKYDNYIECNKLLDADRQNVSENQKYNNKNIHSSIFRGADHHLTPEEFQNIAVNNDTPEKAEEFRRKTLSDFYKLDIPETIENCTDPDKVVDYYKNNKLLVNIGEGFTSQHNSFGSFKKIKQDDAFFSKDAKIFEDTFIMPSSMIGFMANPISFLFKEKVPSLTNDVYGAMSRAVYNKNYFERMKNPNLYATGVGYLGVAKDYQHLKQIGQEMSIYHIKNPIYYKSADKNSSIVKSLENKTTIETRSQEEIDKIVNNYNYKDFSLKIDALNERSFEPNPVLKGYNIRNEEENIFQQPIQNPARKSLVIEEENRLNNQINNNNNILNESSENIINVENNKNKQNPLLNGLNEEQIEVFNKIALYLGPAKEAGVDINISDEQIVKNIKNKWDSYKGFNDIKDISEANQNANKEFKTKNHINYFQALRAAEDMSLSPEEYKNEYKNFNTNEKVLYYRDQKLKKLLHTDVTDVIDAMMNPAKGANYLKNNLMNMHLGFAVKSLLGTNSKNSGDHLENIFNGDKGVIGDTYTTLALCTDYNRSIGSFLFAEQYPTNVSDNILLAASIFANSDLFKSNPEEGMNFYKGLTYANQIAPNLDTLKKVKDVLKDNKIKDIGNWKNAENKMPTCQEIIDEEIYSRGDEENVDSAFDEYKAAAIESKKKYPDISTEVTAEEEEYLNNAKRDENFNGKFSKGLPDLLRDKTPSQIVARNEESTKRIVDQYIKYKNINGFYRFFSHFTRAKNTETGRARAALEKSMNDLFATGHINKKDFYTRVENRRKEIEKNPELLNENVINQQPVNQEPINNRQQVHNEATNKRSIEVDKGVLNNQTINESDLIKKSSENVLEENQIKS